MKKKKKNKREEKQILYLQRNWELLEVFKRYRMRIPSLISGAMLVLTSFVLQNRNTIAKETPELLGITSLVLLMGVLGCTMVYWIWKQYKFTNEKIDYLYKRLEMDDENFKSPKEKQKKERRLLEKARRMFYAGYIMIGFTCSICILGLISPLFRE